MSDSYDVVLRNYLKNPFNKQVFLAHLHFATQCTEDKQTITFPFERRLIALDKTKFLYGNQDDTLSFCPLQDATHIYYDTSGEDSVLTLPLMLKISGDVFSVFLEEGWVEFSYPLSKTGINIDTLYHL